MNFEILTGIKHLSKHDKVLSTLIKNYGICNLQPHKKYFNSLLRSIVGQQLSVTAANAISKKFFRYFDNKPKPENIIAVPHEDLRKLGLSNAKAKYVKDLSQKIINKEINLKTIGLKTNDEIIVELTKVKGIGVWTVHMFLIFTLARLDVLPYSDLGVQKGIMLNYGLKKLPDEKKIFKIAKQNNWHPYSSIVSLYLWQSLDNKPFDNHSES
jgi:DNA-3-methyladenine glycosylase II